MGALNEESLRHGLQVRRFLGLNGLQPGARVSGIGLIYIRRVPWSWWQVAIPVLTMVALKVDR